MSRILTWLRHQADLLPNRKAEPGKLSYDVELSPGQYAELCKDLGHEVQSITTSCGQHLVKEVKCHVKATGDNVILCPREDLFSEVERDTGFELVSLANSVTSVPDNIACCEIVSVGELVTNVKVGDTAFIDFYEVKQGGLIQNDDFYIAGADAFKALYDPNRQEIVPLENYVVTRQSKDRMKLAMTGTDKIEVLDYILTDGIVSGRSSQGNAATHVLYQEVVATGKLTTRARPGVMTPAERDLLDMLCKTEGNFDWQQYDGVSTEEANLINTVRAERAEGRENDIKVGDLVVFCKEIGTKIRVRGEVQYLIPYENVLSIIDDEEIYQEALKRGSVGKIVRVA